MRNPSFSGFASADHKSMSARDGVLPVRASRSEGDIFPWERRREASCAEAASGAGRLRRSGKEFLETVSTLNPPRSWKSYPATLPWRQHPSGQPSMRMHVRIRPCVRSCVRACIHPGIRVFVHACVCAFARAYEHPCIHLSAARISPLREVALVD